MSRLKVFSVLSCFALLFAGCSGSDDAAKPTAKKSKPKTKSVAQSGTNEGGATTSNDKSDDVSFAPVTLSGGNDAASGSNTNGASGSDAPPKREDVVAGLQPIQKVLIGGWQGLVQKKATQEQHRWLWDFKSDKVFPALVLKAPEGNYFVEMRLTFDPRKDKYVMQVTDKDSKVRQLEGQFVEAPHDVPSDDPKILDRKYKLELVELDNPDSRERFRFTINQQENNRYLVEVGRARGMGMFQSIDVIASQREGTSFARADTDYGEKTCVISEGLGTSTVSFEGKTYWVCCSGCKAAFEDDPKGWIAKFEAKKKEKK